MAFVSGPPPTISMWIKCLILSAISGRAFNNIRLASISAGQIKRIVRLGGAMRFEVTSCLRSRATSRIATQPLAFPPAPDLRQIQALENLVTGVRATKNQTTQKQLIDTDIDSLTRDLDVLRYQYKKHAQSVEKLFNKSNLLLSATMEQYKPTMSWMMIEFFSCILIKKEFYGLEQTRVHLTGLIPERRNLSPFWIRGLDSVVS